MESKGVYKLMLIVQSAMFIAFLMYFGTNSAVTPAPQMAKSVGKCDCERAGADGPPTPGKTCKPPGRASMEPVLREPNEPPAVPGPTEAPAVRAPATQAPANRAPTQATVPRAPTKATVPRAPTKATVPRAPTKATVPRAPTKATVPRAPTVAPAVRGPISNCTKADLLKRPNVVLLVTTNMGFLDMTLNMLMSVARTGVCVNTTVIAEDQATHQYLLRRAGDDPAVHVVGTDSGQMPTNIRRYTQAYFKLFSKRQPYMLSFLRRGLDVLFSDSDTFWFRDPFPYFQGDFDVSMIDSKSPYPKRSDKANFCAGFIYLKPTASTVRFLETWIETMDNQSRSGRIRADQSTMNDLLRRDVPVHINIKPLDTNIFPWGPKFYSLLAKKAGYPTVVMHAASIRGHDAKMDKFKSSNMWLVNATTAELLKEQSGQA